MFGIVNLIGELSNIMVGYSLDLVSSHEGSTYESSASDIIRFDYLVVPSKIGIQFSLSIATGALLVVRINNPNGETFSLDDYLTKYEMKNYSEKLFINRRDISTSLQLIIELFNGDLNDIISGKRWENVPRDWMGYK